MEPEPTRFVNPHQDQDMVEQTRIARARLHGQVERDQVEVDSFGPLFRRRRIDPTAPNDVFVDRLHARRLSTGVTMAASVVTSLIGSPSNPPGLLRCIQLCVCMCVSVVYHLL